MYDYLRAEVNPKTGAVMTSLVDLCLEGCHDDPNGGPAGAAVGVQTGGTGLFGSEINDSG